MVVCHLTYSVRKDTITTHSLFGFIVPECSRPVKKIEVQNVEPSRTDVVRGLTQPNSKGDTQKGDTLAPMHPGKSTVFCLSVLDSFQ